MNIARLRGTKGFTLIELIVVIVIMGILVAIGAFAYNSFIHNSRSDAAQKTAVQVGKDVSGLSATTQTAYKDLAGADIATAVNEDVSSTGWTAVVAGDWDAATATLSLTGPNNCTAQVVFDPNKVGSVGTATGSCS